MTKRLITTADDFGRSREVNEAVIRACREGVLTNASLMVAEPWAAEAVERARSEAPELELGLHIVFCGGRAKLPPARLEGMVDAEGRFPDDPVSCGLRYFFRRGLLPALEREARAQFEAFLGFGLRPGHLDGHVNIHVHPVVFPLVVRLAKEYGFGRVRLPGGELPTALRYSSALWPKQLLEGSVFELLRAYLRRAHADPKVSVVDRTFGLLRSGLMEEPYLLEALERLPEGVSEIYFHPSSDPASEANGRPTPTHLTITELRTLTSRAVRRRIGELGIELGNTAP